MSSTKTKKPQDKEREDELVTMFGLHSTNENRIGTDATDDFGNPYELKTTTKAGVSTARDVGINHLNKWRKLYWICAKGHYDEAGIFQFTETYFLFPEQLEAWFSKIERKVQSKDELFKRVIDLLREQRFSTTDIEQLEYVFKRGVLLNDPNIPWSYITTHGTRITDNYAERLRELVTHKSDNAISTEEAHLDFMFDEEDDGEPDEVWSQVLT